MQRLLYSIVFYLVSPLFIVHLLVRGLGNPAYWRRWPERFGLGSAVNTPGSLIWIHAVSVGETRATQPLVAALRQHYPDHRILLTTTTPTGSDQVRLLYGDTVDHCYMPYDLPGAIRRFLRRWQPSLAIIMETEIWPNLFQQCRARNIALCMMNVRISDKSFGGYQRFAPLVRLALSDAALIMAQTATDRKRLQALGARSDSLHVTGSIKYDLSVSDEVRIKSRDIHEQWGTRRAILLAASTHDGEEQQLLTVYRRLKQQYGNLLLELVPRHPERFDAVTRLAQSEKYKVMRRTRQQGQPLSADVDILVGDTMGELQAFYGACTLAFVGGSLAEIGGHNILEAAALGVPTLVGPHVSNFRDITRDAVAEGATVQVDNADQLFDVIDGLLADPAACNAMANAARDLVENNRGALASSLRLIESVYPGAKTGISE